MRERQFEIRLKIYAVHIAADFTFRRICIVPIISIKNTLQDEESCI